MEFPWYISIKSPDWNFTEIRIIASCEDTWTQTDRRTDGRDKANRRFARLWERASKASASYRIYEQIWENEDKNLKWKRLIALPQKVINTTLNYDVTKIF